MLHTIYIMCSTNINHQDLIHNLVHFVISIHPSDSFILHTQI